MARNNINRTLFNRNKMIVITPTFQTTDELEKAVAMLIEHDDLNGGRRRISQWMFLKILGMRRPIGLREYRNDVLLNTGVVKHVNDYYYMQFDTVQTNRPVESWFDPGAYPCV